MKQRSTSEFFRLQRPKLSFFLQHSSSAPSTSLYYAHTPHSKNISTVLPDTAAELSTPLSPQITQSSHEMQSSAQKSPPLQRVPLKASPIQRTPFQGTDNNAGSTELHGISMNSSPVVLDSPPSSSLEHLSQSASTDIYSTDTLTSHSSTSSLSSADLSQSPTAFISTPPPFPKQEGNSVKNRENKVSTVYISR